MKTGPTPVCEDVPCRTCGYNLRSLRLDAVCPEWGSAVRISLRGSRLRYSDPAWVRWVATGIALSIAGGFLEFFEAFVVTFRILGRANALQLIGSAFVFGTVLNAVGAWMYTTLERGGPEDDRYVTHRNVIRATSIIVSVNALLQFVMANMAWTPIPIPLAQWIGLVARLTGAIGMAVQLHYFETLSARLPNPILGLIADILRRNMPMAYAVWNISIAVVLNSQNVFVYLKGIFLLSVIAGAGFLVLWGGFMFLLINLRRRLLVHANFGDTWRQNVQAMAGSLICDLCGASLPDSYKFCPHDGAALKQKRA